MIPLSCHYLFNYLNVFFKYKTLSTSFWKLLHSQVHYWCTFLNIKILKSCENCHQAFHCDPDVCFPLSFSRCLHTVSWQSNGELEGKQRGATFCFLYTLIASATCCVIALYPLSFIIAIIYSTLHFIPPSSSWWRTCWRRCQPCSARAERPIVPSAQRSKQPSSWCRPLGAVSPFFRPSCRRWGLEHFSRGKTPTSVQARR